MKRKNKFILLLLFVTIIGSISIYYFGQKPADLRIISLKDFRNLTSNTTASNTYIYVGRTSCPSCETIYPALCQISKKRNLSIYYYNTEEDREKNPEEMYPFLEQIGVKIVPSIVQTSNGVIKKIFSSDDFLDLYK